MAKRSFEHAKHVHFVPEHLSRRRILTAAPALTAALALPKAFAQAAICAPTDDAGEGPFYFDPRLVRTDITDGRPGAPFDVTVKVTRRDCSPLADARFDLWQADGLGLYSGYKDQPGVGGIDTAPAVGATFLRGTQRTDAEGQVRFKTIYPSWYGGRAPHLHLKVFVAGQEVLATQILFDEEVNAEVFHGFDPYREYVGKRTVFNDNDRFLDANRNGRLDGVFGSIERLDGSGIAATATVAVDV